MTNSLYSFEITDENNSYFLPMNLSLFQGEKTEEPTPRKKEKAREEGQVAQSQEIGTAFLFLAMFSMLRSQGPKIFYGLMEIFVYLFQKLAISTNTPDLYEYRQLFFYLGKEVFLLIMPLFLVAIAVGVIVNVAQVGWHPTFKPLTPKFSRLNPGQGIKKMFSAQALLNLFKSLAKFILIAYIIINTLLSHKEELFLFLDLSLLQGMSLIGNLIIDLGLRVGGFYLVIAALDFAFVFFKHRKELRMTKQEVKEEYKMSEGNPEIKGRIKQKMREASMQRMMMAVPEADVVITNPTHIAVALKYDDASGAAPIVLAKGIDFLALKIKDTAKNHHIQIVEDKPLARTLYALVEVGEEIPPELYQAVAEILAYVYRLQNRAS